MEDKLSFENELLQLLKKFNYKVDGLVYVSIRHKVDDLPFIQLKYFEEKK